MKILAVDSSAAVASVAILSDNTVLGEYFLDNGNTHSETILPMTESLLSRLSMTLDEIDLFAVSIGPGSFTGLRVGVVSAKTFAWAVNADIIGVASLDVCACQAPKDVEKISVAFDCQRGQVIYRDFDRSPDGTFAPAGDEKTVAWRDWLAQTEPDRWLSGPYVNRIATDALENRLVVAPELRAPTAKGVGELAIRQYAAGKKDVLWDLLPRYSRPAAAEEKRNKRQ